MGANGRRQFAHLPVGGRCVALARYAFAPLQDAFHLGLQVVFRLFGGALDFVTGGGYQDFVRGLARAGEVGG